MSPERTCLGCGAAMSKSELVRLVSKDGALVPDHGGSLPGRGAYLCRKKECVTMAYGKKDPFSRALKVKLILPGADDLWEGIKEEGKGKDGV